MNLTTIKTDLRDALANPYIILMALVVIVSANSLGNDFLVLDDKHQIVNNPIMRLPLSKVPSIFTRPLLFQDGTPTPYYRPMMEMLYIFNHKIWGMNPTGFHLTSIMLHLLNAIFTYRIGLLLLNNDKAIALVAASLFAVHPVNSEPICRVAMIENLYGLFMITSIYFFLKNKTYLSWLLFFLALLSKESAVMLPAAICILAIQKFGVRKCVVPVIPYAGIVVLYLGIRFFVVNSFWGVDIPQPFFSRFFTMTAAFLDYTRLLLLPYPLHVSYPARLYTSLSQPKILTAFLLFLLFALFAFKLRKDKIMLFLLLTPFILLLPVAAKANTFSIVTDLQYISERYLYVPAMIFSLFMVTFIARPGRFEARKRYVTAAFAVAIGVFAGITISYGSVWRNDATLIARIMEEAPDSAASHCFRADVSYERGEFDEAIKEIDEAFYPNLSFVKEVWKYRNADKSGGGTVLANQDKSSAFAKLGKYQPLFANLHFALGRIYMVQGDLDGAIKKFNVTLVLEPDNPEAHLYLAEAYMKRNEFDKARKEFRFILDRDRRR